MKRIVDIGDLAELEELGEPDREAPLLTREACSRECAEATSALVPGVFFLGCVLGGALGVGLGTLAGTWIVTRKGAAR